jgi:hypothetical protein
MKAPNRLIQDMDFPKRNKTIEPEKLQFLRNIAPSLMGVVHSDDWAISDSKMSQGFLGAWICLIDHIKTLPEEECNALISTVKREQESAAITFNIKIQSMDKISPPLHERYPKIAENRIVPDNFGFGFMTAISMIEEMFPDYEAEIGEIDMPHAPENLFKAANSKLPIEETINAADVAELKETLKKGIKEEPVKPRGIETMLRNRLAIAKTPDITGFADVMFNFFKKQYREQFDVDADEDTIQSSIEDTEDNTKLVTIVMPSEMLINMIDTLNVSYAAAEKFNVAITLAYAGSNGQSTLASFVL